MVDEKTFSDACQALFPVLHRIGMSIVRSDADAQDAVQQALMKAWVHRGQIHGDKLRAWLTRTMVNECRNIQRRRMRVLPVWQMYENEAYTPPDLGLAEAVHALPEKLRVPLLLKYGEGYAEKEVAEALQLTVPAVKNRLYRARRALAKSLKAEVAFK